MRFSLLPIAINAEFGAISLFLFSCDKEHPELPGEKPSCGPLIDTRITAQVLERHLTGFGLRDVDKIMVDYMNLQF